MATDLYALAEQVEDEAGFLRFLAALAADWEEDRRLAAANPPKPFGSRDGLPGYSRPENAWRRAAQLMLAGKFYE